MPNQGGWAEGELGVTRACDGPGPPDCRIRGAMPLRRLPLLVLADLAEELRQLARLAVARLREVPVRR